MGRNSSAAEKVKQVLQLVQKETTHLTKEQLEYCNEACVERYLRARGGNVKKAAKHLKASLAWRASLEMGYLTADDFTAELAAGSAFVAGHDDNGLPVLVLRMRHEFIQPRSQKRFLRFLVFSFEVAIASMPPGVHQWVMLIDFAGSTSSPPLSLIFAVLKLISDHYPERLAPSFFVDAPSMFYYLWKGVAPFVEQATREKWRFVSLKDADCYESSSCSSSSCTPSFRHTGSACSYEERLNAMSFLTPLSSPGGQSFFKRNYMDNSLGAALASEVQQQQHHQHHQQQNLQQQQQQHRSLSFSSPASRTFRTPEAECTSLGRADSRGLYGSPVFGRSGRSRRSASRDIGSAGFSLFGGQNSRQHQQSSNSSKSGDAFRPYARLCKSSYDESSYRAMMKPPLGGLLSVIRNALHISTPG